MADRTMHGIADEIAEEPADTDRLADRSAGQIAH